MTPDDVIALRHTWDQHHYVDHNGNADLPKSTILATADWLAYVTAMADAIPDGPTIEFPTEAEVRWAWPDGVVIVLDHPVDSEHVIISENKGDGFVMMEEPHYQRQLMRAIVIGPESLVSPVSQTGLKVVYPDGTPVMYTTHSIRYIGEDPVDYCVGHLTFGAGMRAAGGLDHIGGVGRLLLAVVNALGHRLTTVTAPSGLDRYAAKRLARSKLAELRVLELTSGASTESRGGTVEWSHRWMVRGHWRDQPCGPGNSLRRLTWIDPHVKGPSDKPLDVRSTIWKAAL